LAKIILLLPLNRIK